MKLFWKLFCSMVIITVLSCSLGGYVLIDQQFRASLNREVSALYEENDLLRYAMVRELELYPIAVDQEALGNLLGKIRITTSRGSVTFRVSDESGTAVATNGILPMTAITLTSQLAEGQRGWELKNTIEGKRYIHAASPLSLDTGTYYLENCRDVTELFANRQFQYQGFFTVLLILAAVVGILSMAVTSAMLRPLSRLSHATHRIAEGNLNQRIPVTSDDELGQLSADFNAMAARLEAQVQELTEAARRQEEFIGSFAHEIKTPLTSIIGYADLLRSMPATPEQVLNSAGYIFSEGRRLEALSLKLMDIIVLEKQIFSLHMIPMDSFLRQVGGALRPALETSGIHLTIRADAAKIPLDADLMESVCLNLVDNARKSIDGNGTIMLEGMVEEGGYCIRVTDSGKGIPAEDLSRITEAFYMVDKSRARAQGGAGWGLAVCQRIVDLHGGTMEFHSTEGKGTQVWVHLKGDTPT